MSRHTKRKDLGRFLGIPGGITVATATERASENLDILSERAIGQIDWTLDSFSGYLDLLSGAPPDAVRDELYRLASEIVSLSAFDRESLGQAAFSLCRLLSVMKEKHEWRRSCVDVHQDAMRSLNRPDVCPTHLREVLGGLSGLSGSAHDQQR